MMYIPFRRQRSSVLLTKEVLAIGFACAAVGLGSFLGPVSETILLRYGWAVGYAEPFPMLCLFV